VTRVGRHYHSQVRRTKGDEAVLNLERDMELELSSLEEEEIKETLQEGTGG
jgi:hypothetical protein